LKQSNITTPRTLADCQFTVGHPMIDRVEARGHAAVYIISVVGCVVFVGMLIAGQL
jgi:hypothetical protein